MRKVHKCANCGADTRNPVYCCSSCAASYNNVLRRKIERHRCVDCGKELDHKESTRCMKCHHKSMRTFAATNEDIANMYKSGMGERQIAKELRSLTPVQLQYIRY